MTQAALSSKEAAWLSLVNRLPIPYEQFEQYVSDWDIHPITVRGQMAGALLVKDAEIHACVLPEFKGQWLTRKELRILNQVIEQHGYAQTSATTSDGEQFVTRLGFEQHGELFRRTRKWALKPE